MILEGLVIGGAVWAFKRLKERTYDSKQPPAAAHPVKTSTVDMDGKPTHLTHYSDGCLEVKHPDVTFMVSAKNQIMVDPKPLEDKALAIVTRLVNRPAQRISVEVDDKEAAE